MTARGTATVAIADRYRRFAADEARGRSPLYEMLALGIADDSEILAFLLSLPEAKQQPNLLLASVRHHCGTAADWPTFRQMLAANRAAVRATMLGRSTQTNEPARCATLLPVLARLPQPLALIEVGASAGLCLLPDHYAYDYGRGALRPPAPLSEPPVLRCTVSGATPIPVAMPQIAWRAGLDLNPLDAGDPEQRAWLETLVWPEQTSRLANLRAALAIAAGARPRIVRGDLLGDALTTLARGAPKDATLVVFHTAVLAYVAGLDAREEFGERAMAVGAYWIANEAPGVLPGIASRTGTPAPHGHFLMSVNGTPVAWTDPHGATLDWIADPAAR
jgi:hypothetical protein